LKSSDCGIVHLQLTIGFRLLVVTLYAESTTTLKRDLGGNDCVVSGRQNGQYNHCHHSCKHHTFQRHQNQFHCRLCYLCWYLHLASYRVVSPVQRQMRQASFEVTPPPGKRNVQRPTDALLFCAASYGCEVAGVLWAGVTMMESHINSVRVASSNSLFASVD